jgi:hypothetical protein
MNRPLLRIGIAAAFTLAALAGAAAENVNGIPRNAVPRVNDGPGLSLRVNDEAAPAGSIVQIKIDVTEPKPISTGRGKIKIRNMAPVNGIVLMNEGQDTYGLALVEGEDLTFVITSPSGTFGTPADYPILGIAATVTPAPEGSSFPLTLDPSGLTFRDPSGAVYPYEIKNGTLTVDSKAIAIGNVSPGSSIVPAGGVVRITGANFTPNTRLQLSETSIAEQRFVSSQRIDVVLAQTTNMHGLRVRARNDEKDNKSESEYFSYERATAIGASNDAVLSKVVPLFAPAHYTAATIDFPRQAAGARRRAVRTLAETKTTAGLALQTESTAATVVIELLDKHGNPYAINTVSIGPDQYLVREIGELFGIVAPPSAVRLRSNVPVHVLGLIADHANGTAAAVAPH